MGCRDSWRTLRADRDEPALRSVRRCLDDGRHPGKPPSDSLWKGVDSDARAKETTKCK